MSYPKKYEETPFTKCENCNRPRWRHTPDEYRNCQLARGLKS